MEKQPLASRELRVHRMTGRVARIAWKKIPQRGGRYSKTSDRDMRKRRGVWMAVVGAALLAGCGGGDDGGSTASMSAVTVSGDEYSFDAPATIEGGLTTI